MDQSLKSNPLTSLTAPPTCTRVSKPDKVETPIIACNDNFSLNRIRRPSTPNKPPKSILIASQTVSRKGRDDKKQGSRIRSASAGRDHKSEMSSRYWTYLFENLERSISEIYEGCEKEENVRQCKEVILILENYTRDFTKLIEWFQLKWSYEKTPPPMRPQALAWEIRKPSLCLLPHTRAYEKLLGLKESTPKPGDNAEPLQSIGSVVVNANSSACAKSNRKGSVSPVINSSSSIAVTNSCVSSTLIVELPLTEASTVDIGLQTDLEEDPDIYYIAGGRSVAFQTDYTEEYGPLNLSSFLSLSMPVVVVLNSADSDMEFVADPNTNNNNNNSTSNECEAVIDSKTAIDDQLNSKSNNNNPSENQSANGMTDKTSNAESVVGVFYSGNNNDYPLINTSVRPTTPIETKSSATQLSAGVLITDEVPLEKELRNQYLEKKECCEDRKENELSKSATTIKDLEAKKSLNNNGVTTFAEKAKNGMLRQSQNQAKSVSSYLNKVGAPSVSSVPAKPQSILSKPTTGGNLKTASSSIFSSRVRVTLSAGISRPHTSSLATGQQQVVVPKPRVTTAPVIPNYRSNIASRCRAAVNTGQVPQVELQQSSKTNKDKNNKSSTSPMPPVSPTISAGADSILQAFLPSSSVANSSSASVQDECKSSSSALLLHSEADEPVLLSGESAPEQGVLNKSQRIVPVPQPQAQPVPVGVGAPSSKPGITRSKSLIHPFPSAKGRTNSGKPNNASGLSAKGPMGSFKRLHSNSYISLPDETIYRRKSHTIDDDGWETVKARSSRSKWSLSNSSLGSSNANQSRSSLDKGIPKTTNTTKSALTSNNKSTDTRTKSVISDSQQLKNSESNSKQKSPSKNKKLAKGKITTGTTKNMESGDAPQKESNEDDIAVDDEEIKRKEADLDNAIREEELLEELLRQVEKDFERIENDSATDDGTMTDSEHAVSPEVVDIEEMDDQFFCISIDDPDGAKVEDLPPRDTGRILSFREKLMSPAKKCDGAETLKRYEAKLAKAERNREKLLQAKFNRYVELTDRFEALNETTKKLVSERSELIMKAEERRTRAVEKRQEYIKNIQRKAHDEDSKAKEIAFINLLEAQNKRHDYFATAQEIEGRLQTIQDDRRLKLEERAGKASAVIFRQSGIKKDWQSKLTTLQEKRRNTEERIKREREERAKERSEIAQEKARDREGRMSALNAAKQTEKEELQKKIRQKQEDTARRHEENMEQIRQKAIELGAPRVQEENSTPSSYRVCTLCNVIILSGIHEMQHIRSRAHLEAVKKAEKSSPLDSTVITSNGGLMEGFGLKFIADVQVDKIDSKVHPDKNRNKSLKKHSKKLMQKLMESGLEFEKSVKENKSDIKQTAGDPHLRSKTRRNLLELDRLISLFINNKGSPNIATSMDRIMAEIRKASVQHTYIKDVIIGMNGLEIALKVLQCQAVDLPVKSKIHAIEMIHGFIIGSLENGLYILRGTGICILMNLCTERWSTLIPDDNRWRCGSPLGINESLPTDYFIQSIVELLFNVLEFVPDPFNGISKKGSYLTQDDLQSIKLRTYDIIGYLVSSGVIDRISVYCSGVRGPVDEHPAAAMLLRIFIDFLVVLVYALQFCWGENPAGCIMHKKEPDGTQLLAALEASELAGAVSMSYSLLLYQGAPSRPRTTDGTADLLAPPPPGEKTVEVVKSTLCLINAMARLDLLVLQNVLASESVSLQFRHIASQLLWQVVPHRQSVLMRRLLTELIISIGNFTVGNKHNQATIQSGQTPTVLQLLCSLPQEYFTDSKLKQNFLPTLLSATQGCPENREILTQNNISLEMLDSFLNSDEGKRNVIIRRMVLVTSQPPSTLMNGKGNTKKGKTHNKDRAAKVKPLEESNNKNTSSVEKV